VLQSKEYVVPVPFSGLHVPGRSNPVLVLLSPKSLLVEIDFPESGCRVEGISIPGLAGILCTYVARLGEALGSEIEVMVKVDLEEEAPRSSIVALLTLALVEAYGAEAGYSFSRDELLEYTSILDAASGYRGWQSSLLRAVREAALSHVSLIHRAGEGSIRLPQVLEALPRECIGMGSQPLVSDEDLLNALTHLAGLVTLGIAGALRREDRERIKEYWLVEDGPWYSLWGIDPRRGLKTAPDLGGVCLVEPRASGS
jgi:hypothetical protein